MTDLPPPLIDLRIEGEPARKARPRFGANGHAITPKETRAAELALAWRVKEKYVGLEPTTGIVRLDVHFDSTCPRYRRNGRTDLDNLLKLVSDALNGIAWADDWQIEEIHASMTRDSPTPGTTIRAYVIEEVAHCQTPQRRPSSRRSSSGSARHGAGRRSGAPTSARSTTA